MAANYESEPDEAQRLFWSNIMEDRLNSTSRKIYLEIQEIKKTLSKTAKIDGWKFLRSIAADVIGKIDNLSK